MDSTTNLKISPPEVKISDFNKHPFVAYKSFNRELSTYLMAQGHLWTLIFDPVARLEHPTNPWQVGGSANAIKGRKDHAKGQALLAHILEAFNKVTRSKDAVNRSKIELYYTQPAYPTGEPFCAATELYHKLEVIFTPLHEGELDMHVRALLVRINEFPGLTSEDIKRGGAILREFINDISGEWSTMQSFPAIAAQEPMLFRTLTENMQP